MDPAANITEQLEIAAGILADSKQSTADIADAAERLAELVLELAAWRAAGGFVPYINSNRGERA